MWLKFGCQTGAGWAPMAGSSPVRATIILLREPHALALGAGGRRWCGSGAGRRPRLACAASAALPAAKARGGLDEVTEFETDVLAGFVLARAAAGLADKTIRSDVGHVEQIRSWFGCPLWEMTPPDGDVYFGQVLRRAAPATRSSRAQALKTYFLFLDLRHKVEIHNLTGHVLACPVDEMNRPRGQPALRCVSRRARPRSTCCLPGGVAGWQRAASLPPPRVTTRSHIPVETLRRSKWPRNFCHSVSVGTLYSSVGRRSRRRARNARCAWTASSG